MSDIAINSTLVLLGVNHNTAPIEIRERLAIPAERLADATRSLVSAPGIREGFILSTCNRVELLTLQEASRPPIYCAFSTNIFRFQPPRFARTSTSSASEKRCGTCFA
jgi:glutamyl-tRNA reductase